MSHRTRNLRKAVRANDHNRRLRQAAGVFTGDGDILGARPARPRLDGYPGPGAVNAYHCPDCNTATVVVHVDQGVTPMFLACRATDGCHGRGVSTGYRLDPASLPEPTHEWYRPDELAQRRLDPAMRSHVAQGGLVLRPIA